jgi:hypothetical protein
MWSALCGRRFGFERLLKPRWQGSQILKRADDPFGRLRRGRRSRAAPRLPALLNVAKRYLPIASSPGYEFER